MKKITFAVAVATALSSSFSYTAAEAVVTKPIAPVPISVSGPVFNNNQMLARAAQALILPIGELKIQDNSKITYPITGTTALVVKVWHTPTSEAHVVAFDIKGNPVDLSTLQQAEKNATLKIGKINPRLQAKLNTVSASVAVPVSIWIKAPANLPSRPGVSPSATTAQVTNAVNAHLQAMKATVAPARANVVSVIKGFGVEVKESQYAPAVFASLTKAQIKQIEQSPDVIGIYYGAEDYKLHNDDGATTTRANRVWQVGNTGRGVYANPIVHEPDGVSDVNSKLYNLNHPVAYYCSTVNATCPKGKNLYDVSLGSMPDHASAVAGVIASSDPLYRGIAPNVPLILSANSQDFTDANLVAAFEWGASQGAVTNMSWGADTGGTQIFLDIYFDWAVKNLFHTIVASAGNSGIGASVGSPALGWNIIAVGSIDDNDNGNWAGDTMSFFSSTANPVTGQEKPDVVAVGSDITTTSSNTQASGDTYVNVNGTSFSGPEVAGQVALLVARQPGQRIWPETNRAAVLASTNHNVVAGIDQDGFGAVMMTASDNAYRLNQFRNHQFNSADINVDDVVALTAGQVVRVAIAWDSLSNGSNSDILGIDLDLHILNPSGTVITTSSSFSNSEEVVEFTVPTTGNYTFRTHKFSQDPSFLFTWSGTVWAVKSIPSLCSSAVNVAAGGGTFNNVNTANGGTYVDSYTGVPWTNNTGREAIYRLTTTAPRNITVTDTNVNLDLFIVSLPANCLSTVAGTPTVRGFGINSASYLAAPAGTYYVIVDGFDGSVGATNLTISVTP